MINILSVDDINDTELSVEIGFNAAKALFDLDVPPDAIFTVTDDVAIGVYEFCKQKGIQIPYRFRSRWFQ